MSGIGERSHPPVTASVTDEVDAIIMAAERVAEAIRREAEQRAEERLRAAEEAARHYVDGARRDAKELSARLASVVQVRRQLEAALSALTAAEEGLPEPGQTDGSGTDRPRPWPFEGAPERSRGRAREHGWPIGDPGGERAKPGLTGARLVAIQMALAGSSRAEVEAHLERTFGPPASEEMLDEAFGVRQAETGSARPGAA